MSNFYGNSDTFSSSTMKTSEPNAKSNRKTHIKGWNDVSYPEYLRSKDGQDWFRNMMNQSIKNLNSKNGTNIPYIAEPEEPERAKCATENKNISPETRCDKPRKSCNLSNEGRGNERISKARCGESNKMYDWLRSEPEPEPERTKTQMRNRNVSPGNRWCKEPRRDCRPAPAAIGGIQPSSKSRCTETNNRVPRSEPEAERAKAKKPNRNCPPENRCGESRRNCRSPNAIEGRRRTNSKSRCSGANNVCDWLRSQPEPEWIKTQERNRDTSRDDRCDRRRPSDRSRANRDAYDFSYGREHNRSKPFTSRTRRNDNVTANARYDDTDDTFDCSVSRTHLLGKNDANRKSLDTDDLFRELDNIPDPCEKGTRFGNGVAKTRLHGNGSRISGSSVGCRRDEKPHQQVKPRCNPPPSVKRYASTDSNETVGERTNAEKRIKKCPSEIRREEPLRNFRSPWAVEEFQPVFNVHCEKADDICEWLRSQPAPEWTRAPEPNGYMSSSENLCDQTRGNDRLPTTGTRNSRYCTDDRDENATTITGYDDEFDDESFDCSVSRTSARRSRNGPGDANRKSLDTDDLFRELYDKPDPSDKKDIRFDVAKTRNNRPANGSSARCRRDEKPPQIDHQCRCNCHPPGEQALIDLVEKIRNGTYKPPSTRRDMMTTQFAYFL